MSDPVVPTPITQRSGWQAVLWAAVAAVLEVILVATAEPSWLPEWVQPVVPVVAGFIRFVLSQIRGPASYRAA